ncbi:hypothetical protein DM02DRAFT_535869 [Periconia macrospinosa]|uniref:Cyclin N-terminal domain-containing protein n=1 Tax=Periconia macrospinosa TaxID=97972 RepID=A0A2V1DDD2_9PLEO|nr:hypothetical protein DM02DRAFT_535869 [Periconia macrospinosa]
MSDFSNMDDDELDLYLASCVPLSNLPTPPTKMQSIVIPAHLHRHPPALCTPTLQTPPPEPAVQHHLHEIHVYACHLIDLVTGGNHHDPLLVETVDMFLDRANLPVEIYAFAGCVLEMLEARPEGSERALTILAALSIAHGYLDDRGRSNRHWCLIESAGMFLPKDLQRAKMSILFNIDFGLMRISETAVQRMVKEMQRNLPVPLLSLPGDNGTTADEDNASSKNMSNIIVPGQSIWTFGVQTPEPSP